MSLKAALDLAKKGFYVFPLGANSKLPAIDDFPNRATRDPETIKAFWLDPVMGFEQPYNIGISTSRFGDNEALVVVDVDNKEDKRGSDTVLALEMEGNFLPETYTQTTPTGGVHFCFRSNQAVKQGVSVLGPGIDIRSRGGYIVARGSTVAAGSYEAKDAPVAECPDWIVEKCGRQRESTKHESSEAADVEQAVDRSVYYLVHDAPLSKEGNAGDHTAYIVASRLKDFGCDPATCLSLMQTHWNHRCEPPWSEEELIRKIENAYRYGVSKTGAEAPENQFTKVEESKTPHPFDKLNQEFAFITAGGGHHILWETVDPEGKFKLVHLNELSFHRKFASQTLFVGDGKSRPLTEQWIKSPRRREYKGLCFKPGQEAPEGFYNLWRGFAVAPLAPGEIVSDEMKRALDMFLAHALDNVCSGDVALFNWMMGYFAHMIQKPWEKPLVALVFRGSKGVGKNALIDRVGYLLGSHYLLTSNRRYLIGNFNGHLESLLLFALDEAFWSGDKQAEGTLKDLITGRTHVIEHKGKETYSVENRTRVAIIGNEDWLVPATVDERRFAVFDVGEGKKQQRAYFHEMRELMEAGGYRALLSHLLTLDISKIDVNQAPATSGLMEQKLSSLEPVHQWWFACLTDGRILGLDFGTDWPEAVDKEQFRSAFKRYHRDRNLKRYVPEERSFGRLILKCCPGIHASKRREGEVFVHQYKMPSLQDARAQWAEFIGHNDMKWES